MATTKTKNQLVGGAKKKGNMVIVHESQTTTDAAKASRLRQLEITNKKNAQTAKEHYEKMQANKSKQAADQAARKQAIAKARQEAEKKMTTSKKK